MNALSALGLAFFSGLLLGGAYSTGGLGFFAYAGLIPLFTIIRQCSTGRVLLLSWISGLIFYSLTLYWIHRITWIGMILALPVLAFFYALPFAAARIVYQRYPRLGFTVLPFAVAGFEWIRSFDALAFPWMILGNSQTAYPFFVQFADITSVFGVSAWVVIVNISMYLLVRKKTVRRWLFFAVLFIAPTAYSLSVMHSFSPSGKELTVALIQGNVEPDQKWEGDMEAWNVNLYCTMSIEAMAHKPDLIVWPETATPVYLLQTPIYRRMVQSLVDSIDVPLLTGMPSIDLDTGRTWNAAGFFIPKGRTVQEYRKIHLVPFGEAIPLDNIFPSLRKIDFGQANWDEGTESVVFTSDSVPTFGTVICFESIFPDLVRKFVKKGSEFIVVITNDVWFGPRPAPQQHAMISVFRAIEFHRPIVRCANTGISMIIDQYGRIMKQTGTFERTTLVGTITPERRQTFYGRFGNLFSMASFLVTIACMVFSLYKKYHSGEENQ